MKEIWILCGRKNIRPSYENTNCSTDTTFCEADALEAFESFESGFNKFKEYVTEAFENAKKVLPDFVDEECMPAILNADPLKNYNMQSSDSEEKFFETATDSTDPLCTSLVFEDYENTSDVCWEYKLCENNFAKWQMYPLLLDDFCPFPILPYLYLKKVTIN